MVRAQRGLSRRFERRFIFGYTRQQTAFRALAVLCISTGISLTLGDKFHLGLAAISVGIVGGLPGLYLAWAVVRGNEDLSITNLAGLADQLAALVRQQWEIEAGNRRLNDPYPLSVSWTAGDADVSDTWDVLTTLARTGIGWPSPSSSNHWASHAGDLAGSGNDITGVLDKVPTKRLVVLGEPGSGKSMLMVRMVLDLLADRVPGGSVPLLVPLASWNPGTQTLRDWLSDRLILDYGALGNKRSRLDQGSLFSQLLKERLIMPLLDGLDEMPEQLRSRAIEAINDALRPAESVVITCRTADYREAISRPHGSGVTLRGAAVIR